MKKSKLSLGLVTALLSVGALAGCDETVTASKRGVLISFNGNEITAAEILEDYYDDSSKYQAIYDSIYSIIVKNYFNVEGLSVSTKQYNALTKNGTEYEVKEIEHKLGSDDMSRIESRAQEKIEIDQATAEENADANNTSVKKELESICAANGVKYDKKLKELKEKYMDDIKKEIFDEDFYTYYVEDLIHGAGTVQDGKTMSDDVKGVWEGYFESQVPYHVSHILVKLDDSANKYADGEISEDNAKKLYQIVNQIAFGDDSFYKIAKKSEDEGSGKLGGDLGIMDTSTSFVNEFKLGVYAYENLFRNKLMGSDEEIVPEDSHIRMSDDIRKNYKESLHDENVVNEDGEIVGLPTIDYSVFEELNEYAEVDESENKKPVMEGSKLVYPRNIIYNKSLNKHSVSFITGPKEMAVNVEENTKFVEDPTGTVDYNGKKYRVDSANCGTGFVFYDGLDKPVLSVKVAGEWQPILCVRAGADYQGIHFIVVNRSAFTTEEDGNGVNMSNYYTTSWPDQASTYPKAKVEGKDTYEGDLTTYVNFSSDETSNTKSRAEEFASKLKSFDSDRLGKYIFLKFKEIEGVRIIDEKLDKALTKWIETSLQKKVDDREESWKKTWTEYIDSLQKQASERSKLVSDTCKLVFKGANQEISIAKAIENLGLADHSAEIEAELKAYYFGENARAKLYDVNGNEIEDADNVLGASVDSLFNKEGGLCNDGKEHK